MQERYLIDELMISYVRKVLVSPYYPHSKLQRFFNSVGFFNTAGFIGFSTPAV